MKKGLLTLAVLLTGVLAALAVLAVPRHPQALEPIAESWPSAEVVNTVAPQADPSIGAVKTVAEEIPPAPAPSAVPSAAPRPDRAARAQWRRCDLSGDPSKMKGCNTPLVLSFDGGPVAYLADGAHAFDIDGAASRVTDWPTARTPWLAVDRDGDGRIADGSELFGSMTVLSTGHRAPDGFAALRELDADGDGKITPADPGFSRLLIWSDRDGDRRSSAGELSSAAAWEIVSIDLTYTSEPRCDERGNCEVERAPFLYRDASGALRTGAVVDVHLAPQR